LGKRTKKVDFLLFILVLVLTLHGGSSAPDISSRLPLAMRTITLIRSRGCAQDMLREKMTTTFTVEIVTEKDDMKKGLSGREGMPLENGMLFVLNQKEPQAFWMKGMRFPLDIIFFDRERKIIEILENLQPCEQCSVFFTKEPAMYALEINAGLSRKYGLGKGDTLVFEAPQ